jgi:hypothetical protein
MRGTRDFAHPQLSSVFAESSAASRFGESGVVTAPVSEFGTGRLTDDTQLVFRRETYIRHFAYISVRVSFVVGFGTIDVAALDRDVDGDRPLVRLAAAVGLNAELDKLRRTAAAGGRHGLIGCTADSQNAMKQVEPESAREPAQAAWSRR